MTKDEVLQRLWNMHTALQQGFVDDPTPEAAERVAEAYENWLRLCDVPQDFAKERARNKRINLRRHMDCHKRLSDFEREQGI